MKPFSEANKSKVLEFSLAYSFATVMSTIRLMGGQYRHVYCVRFYKISKLILYYIIIVIRMICIL